MQSFFTVLTSENKMVNIRGCSIFRRFCEIFLGSCKSLLNESEVYIQPPSPTSVALQAIHGFRETEKSRWSEVNGPIIQRIRDQAFPEGSAKLTLVHVLDLAQNGYIKPHVDSVKVMQCTLITDVARPFSPHVW